MTITSYGTGAYRLARPTDFTTSRAQMDDLLRQLDTGKRATSYAGLGMDRRVSLDLNGKLSTLNGWLENITRAETNLKLASQSVEMFAKLTQETRNDARPDSYVPSASGRSAPQLLAEEKFKQALDLLNTDVGGRFLFSGRSADKRPVLDYSLIMEGDGAGKAGLKQLISERQAADLGLTGLGRLTAAGAGTTATIAEEAGNPNYGFKLAGATSDSGAMAATYTAGPPAGISVDVTGVPEAGDKLRIRLDLPDGTQEEIVLTARAGADGSETDTFLIDDDPAVTAANLRGAISAALGKEARTTLRAASASEAAESFFAGSPSNPPLRVPGPPFETATAAPAPGTDANTVIWYQGDDDPAVTARATASVQADQGQAVSTGARANEEAFQIGLAQLAIFAVEEFDADDPDSKAGYEALASRVNSRIGYADGEQKPAEIIVELGSAQTALAAAKQRHSATKGYLTTTLEGVENVTTEEVAVQILALQTRLQASYQTTSMLSQLSLANYL